MEDSWVSDSPYLHVFDGLEQVHHQIEEQRLEDAMRERGFVYETICYVCIALAIAIKTTDAAA